MSLGMDKEYVAYDEEDDISIIASYTCRTLDKRKELTKDLIKENKSTFKKFIDVVLKPFIERGTVKESLDDLLRINVDKFLNEDIVEYI